MKKSECKNKTQGVTLIMLAITVVVLLILAGVTIYSGKDMLKKAKLEELKTNMLLIQAKARGYVEDATFRMGIDSQPSKKETVREEVYIQEAKLEKANANTIPSDFKIGDVTTCYWLTAEAQSNWGLNKIKLEQDEKYLIQFDEKNVTVEIYNTKGYDGKYKLADIETIQE